MIIKKLKDMPRGLFSVSASAVAIGNFDGMHQGHTALMRLLTDTAQKNNYKSMVFTFESYTKKSTPVLMEPQERNRILASLGIDYLILADYSDVRGMSAEDFVNRVLGKKLRCKTALCGYNFRFGRGAEANAQTLKTLMEARGGDALILPPVKTGRKTVSSTLIRSYIKNGEIEAANQLLSHPFSVTLAVVHGKKLGRTIGIPTVNQIFPKNYVIPRFGVYACEAQTDCGVFPAVTNVGVRPTVEDNGQITCESHLVGFSHNVYGKKIKITFFKFLRPEQKFDSIALLRAQVERDKTQALQYLVRTRTGSIKGEENIYR